MELIGGEVRIDTEGEGSRGGHIIGHTSSGKPVYSSFHHSGHKGFSEEEHIQAQRLQRKRGETAAREGKGSVYSNALKHEGLHQLAAEKLEK